MFTANLRCHPKTYFLIFGRRNIMFIWVSHIYVLAWSWNWTLSWSSSPNYIFHSGIPSFHPILFLTWSSLSTCQAYHRIGGAEHFVDGNFWADLSACCHSNLLCLLPLILCRWGSAVLMCIFLQFIWVKPLHGGLLLFGVALLFL